MRNKRYTSLLLIAVLLLTAAVSCGKPGLPEQSSLASSENDQTTAPPPLLTDGLTKPPDIAADTYEYTAYNLLPYNEPASALIINRQKELLELVENKTPYNDLITKTVDIYEFIRTFSPNPNILEFCPSLAALDENIGIECIRKSKAGNYYSIHELKQGGLLYIFYSDWVKSIDYLRMHNWFVVQKSLSYEDFSTISEGSSLEEVKSIDPVTEIYEQRAYSYKPMYGKDTVSFYSQHYLTNGILTLYYRYADGKWTVVYTEYRNNFQVDLINGSESLKYNGHILETDAIQ